MRPEIPLSLLAIAAISIAPLVSAVCVPRHQKSPGNYATGATTKFIPAAAPKPAPCHSPPPTPLKAAPAQPAQGVVPKPKPTPSQSPPFAPKATPAQPTPHPAEPTPSQPTPYPSPASSTLDSILPSLVPQPSAAPNLEILQTLAVNDPVIKTLCAKAAYPDLCLSSIGEQLPVPGPIDATAVLKLAMTAARKKVGVAKQAATNLVHDPKTDKLALGPLGDCIDSYDDITYSFDETETALAAHDRATVGTMLDTARTDVDTCDQGFEDREELTPLMSSYDDMLAKLTSNCIAIATAGALRL